MRYCVLIFCYPMLEKNWIIAFSLYVSWNPGNPFIARFKDQVPWQALIVCMAFHFITLSEEFLVFASIGNANKTTLDWQEAEGAVEKNRRDWNGSIQLLKAIPGAIITAHRNNMKNFGLYGTLSHPVIVMQQHHGLKILNPRCSGQVAFFDMMKSSRVIYSAHIVVVMHYRVVLVHVEDEFFWTVDFPTPSLSLLFNEWESFHFIFFFFQNTPA